MFTAKPFVLSCLVGGMCLVAGILTSQAYPQSDPSAAAGQGTPAQEGAEADPPKESTAGDPAGGDPFGLSPAPSGPEAPGSSVALDPVEGEASDPARSVSIETAGSETMARIRAALQASVAVEFNEAPLSEVVDYLKDAAKIPIFIDKKALDDVGLGSDTPVTISLQGISLRSLLRIMLGELDLTFVVRDDVLKITTLEEAENELTTRLYPVADLAHEGRIPVVVTRPESRFHLICELIKTHISPDAWEHMGGSGSIAADDAWSFLAVSQTDAVHEEIESLLAALRRARETASGSPQVQESLTVADEAGMAARDRIEEVLRQAMEFDFHEAPLSDVVAFIVSNSGIPVYIDKRALDDVGLGSDTPVTISLSGVPLRSALRHLLQELELTLLLRDEVLQVTTPERADSNLTHRLFVVGDFFESRDRPRKVATPAEQPESLAQLIQRSIAHHSWDHMGGPGTISVVEPWGLLVVTQTEDVLRQIGGLLSGARTLRSQAAQGADSVVGAPGGGGPTVGLADRQSPLGSLAPFVPMEQTMLLKPYAINGGFSVTDLTALIKGTVSGRWTQQESGAGIFPVGNTLFIRHTPSAHAQIEELLQAIGAVVPGGATVPASGFF